MIALDNAAEARLAGVRSALELSTNTSAIQPLEKEVAEKLKNELTQLQLIIWQLPSSAPCRPSVPTTDDKTNYPREVKFSRDVLVASAYFALRNNMILAFESYATQLYAFYQNWQDVIEPTSSELGIIGMLLMGHLVANSIGDFHLTVEQLPLALRSSSPHLKFPIELERNLTEGNFAKILEAQGSMPSPHYQPFLDNLLKAIQDASAKTLELSYKDFDAKAAAHRLFLKNVNDLPAFIAARNAKNAELVGDIYGAPSTTVATAGGGAAERTTGTAATHLHHHHHPTVVFGTAFKRAELNALTDDPAAKLIRWELKDERLIFIEEAIIGSGGYLSRERREVDCLGVLDNVLGYASELERIV
eukprot:Lankesteria_metandrocarpae@DN4043_c0_g1_i1.p1